MTILIVEDDEPFREMLRTILATRGFNVLAAADVATGLELAAGHPIDAALTDFNMPAGDGLQFCRQLGQQSLARGKRIPIWLMTGSPDLTLAAARAAGAEGVIRKPFHLHALIAAFESLV